MKTVLIIAGESSGELYGALLANALKSLWPDVRLFGIGGERMRESGVELMAGVSSALGISEVISSLKDIRRAFKKAEGALQRLRPDILVLIDYPDFNFRLARVAKKLRLKVLYYVSPHIWAWRKGRIKTMTEIADRVAVILPFEEEIYRKVGIPCEFVGHPAMEEIEQYESKMRLNNKAQDSSKIRNPESKITNPVISLLPGSRPNEIKTLLPVYAGIVRRLNGTGRNCRFIMPIAPNIDRKRFESDINDAMYEGVEIVSGGAINALASSDTAVIASGTATLQAALLGIPMVVAYKVSPLTYLAAKALLDIKHISLVNILAGREVVPELIQKKASVENIIKELEKIMDDDEYRSEMVGSLNEIRSLFYGMKPSLMVAEMAGGMAGWIQDKVLLSSAAG